MSSARSAGSNTDQGIFAIKQSLESWSIAEAEISSAYHRLCWEAGIPTPEPEAKGLKKDAEAWEPDRLNALGADGWEAVGLSLKYGDFVAWPVVLFKRPLD